MLHEQVDVDLFPRPVTCWRFRVVDYRGFPGSDPARSLQRETCRSRTNLLSSPRLHQHREISILVFIVGGERTDAPILEDCDPADPTVSSARPDSVKGIKFSLIKLVLYFDSSISPPVSRVTGFGPANASATVSRIAATAILSLF